MGLVTGLYETFVSLATQGGTVQDGGTVLMFAGAVLICLLSLYAGYNVVAMTLDGARRALRATRGASVAQPNLISCG
jgi:hypothetical protein